MTTDDDPISRTLRDGADPELTPGAAERIAAGAWDRAAALRAPTPRRTVRRLGWTVAAAALIVAGVFALRGTEAAFAVDGEPVQVKRGNAWVEAREVAADDLVRAPEGFCELRSRSGDVLRPSARSLFRLVVERADGARPLWRAEFQEGGGVVDGAGVVVSMRDEVVVERDPSAPSIRLTVDLDAAGPRFSVGRGRVVARATRSGERLALAAKERAAFLAVSIDGSVEHRFAKVESWSPDAASRIAQGALSFLDADFDRVGGLTLVGGPFAGRLDGTVGGESGQCFYAYTVPSASIGDALKVVNGAAARRWLDVRFEKPTPAAAPGRYVYEKDGARTEVDVDACGRVVVTAAGGRRKWPDVASFRRGAPDVAALFGDSIK